MLLLLLLFLTSCSNGQSSGLRPMQEINGRDNGDVTLSRPAIYRVRAPKEWIRHDPPAEESLIDTKKALCEFTIPNSTGAVRITIHNFPSENIDSRIPPGAQVARWKRQFTSLDASTVSIIPQAHGGFSGLLFEGTGTIANEEVSVMGWAMQLAPTHYHSVSSLMNDNTIQQTRADYTIKISGPRTLVAQHRKDIIAFARSFELIQELPAPP